MEKVLIDKFVVPEESKAVFLKTVRQSAGFLRALPGFVEGFVNEKTDGASRQNVVTTAVWASEEAFENAKKAAVAEFQRRGFKPQEIMAGLGVEMERSVYERSAY
jgi:heme-degrading monooxygenase HmoA